MNEKLETYFEDFLPVIGLYTDIVEKERFGTEEVVDYLNYTVEETERILKEVSDSPEIGHLDEKEGNWIFDILEGEREEEDRWNLDYGRFADYIDPGFDITPQHYGLARKNIDRIYRNIEDISGAYFKVEDVKQEFESLEPTHLGLILKTLSSIGVFENHGKAYSLNTDLETFKEFQKALKASESPRNFKENAISEV